MRNNGRHSYAAVPDIVWHIHWARSQARDNQRKADLRTKLGNKRAAARGDWTRTELRAIYRELTHIHHVAWRLHATLANATDDELVVMADEDAPALAL
jgi:hypothetical protein